uniref:Uncharacterized protein LOC111101329 isoform X2 n=1 Tax=Crassostrea virginica TaxID=6565 RepID=A0A8B8ADD2_CRAVI|nr:uncharacterized protein LOC111101329 isoform X2 [Crassostrea virginica]
MATETDRRSFTCVSNYIYGLCFFFVIARSAAGYDIQVPTPDLYRYLYLTKYGIPAPNSTHIMFRVRACNDAHVVLRSSGRKELEIVLGGWRNTISCLRTQVQGSCRRRYNGRVLNCKNYQEFVISWEEGRIMVGKMNSGFRDLILDFKLRKPLSNVQIGVSTGFGASGIWMFEDPKPTTLTPKWSTFKTTTTKNSSTEGLTTNSGFLDAQFVNYGDGPAGTSESYSGVAVAVGVLSVLVLAAVGTILWRKKFRSVVTSPKLAIINPAYEGKEMNTYETIQRDCFDENMYTDINSLDVTKMADNNGFYDTAEPLDEKNMYLRMIDGASCVEETRGNSRYLSMAYNEGTDTRVTQQVNPPKYYVDDTYLMPTPSIKKR